MEAKQTRLSGSLILRPAGRVDMGNAEAFKELLLRVLAEAKTALVLDLAELEYISSAGLRAIMIASRAAKSGGVALGVAAMQPVVAEIFAISRFDLVFPCFASCREALARLAPDALAGFDAL
ncbi:MAG: STAS domain-containing protein [Nevskia sp.]|nr:STAS domain-containing protein [Nevskia sp.]